MTLITLHYLYFQMNFETILLMPAKEWDDIFIENLLN